MCGRKSGQSVNASRRRIGTDCEDDLNHSNEWLHNVKY
jgi:hypothetical protein